MFRVAIIGGSQTGNYDFFKEKCIKILRNKAKEGFVILSTGDKFVEQFAERYHIDVERYVADFKKFKKEALKIRNENLLKRCDALIAFKTNIKDNKYILDMAQEKNINTREIKEEVN